MSTRPEQSIVELPLQFQNRAHEALMSVWWTAALLRKVSTRFFHEHLASDAQFNILVVLKDSPDPLTQNDLSKRLLVDKSNITGLIDRLQKQGLIQRTPVEGDRRSYHIQLTKNGDKLISRLDKLYIEKVQSITSGLSDKDCTDLIRIMKKLRSGLVDEQNE